LAASSSTGASSKLLDAQASAPASMPPAPSANASGRRATDVFRVSLYYDMEPLFFISSTSNQSFFARRAQHQPYKPAYLALRAYRSDELDFARLSEAAPSFMLRNLSFTLRASNMDCLLPISNARSECEPSQALKLIWASCSSDLWSKTCGHGGMCCSVWWAHGGRWEARVGCHLPSLPTHARGI
jgi:hypothetical protein